jgi:hypothetical protein
VNYRISLSYRVSRRQPAINVDFAHGDVGLLRESFPLTVSVTNDEENDVYLLLEVSIKSSYPDIGSFI